MNPPNHNRKSRSCMFHGIYNIWPLLHASSMVWLGLITWWRHQMKRFPRHWPFVRGIHRSPVNFPAQRPVIRSFGVFFDLRPNEQLSKQSWGWWFETPSRLLWRHCTSHSKVSTVQALMCVCYTCGYLSISAMTCSIRSLTLDQSCNWRSANGTTLMKINHTNHLRTLHASKSEIENKMITYVYSR